MSVESCTHYCKARQHIEIYASTLRFSSIKPLLSYFLFPTPASNFLMSFLSFVIHCCPFALSGLSRFLPCRCLPDFAERCCCSSQPQPILRTSCVFAETIFSFFFLSSSVSTSFANWLHESSPGGSDCCWSPKPQPGIRSVFMFANLISLSLSSLLICLFFSPFMAQNKKEKYENQETEILKIDDW